MSKITLARALVELKTIDAKITRNLNDSMYVCLGIGKRQKIEGGSISPQEAESSIKANFQSMRDLKNRYNKIKTALVQANATTKVTINGDTMTIAEAIERKNSIVKHEKAFLFRLRQQLQACDSKFESAKLAMDSAVERALSSIYGTDRKNLSEEQISIVVESRKNDFEPTLIDPEKIRNKIKELTEYIENFEAEVNLSLSEVNAQTEIEI